MARRGKFSSRNRNTATFVLQVTSMVDMFTIILVFLLKSYSTSAVQLTPSDTLKLPQSSAVSDPVEALKLVIAKDGIFVGDERIIEFDEGKLRRADVDSTDAKFIRPLYEALDKEASKSKDIAKVNETVNFDGAVVMQADQSLPYGLLKKVMYTSMLAGYSDVKMAVISTE